MNKPRKIIIATDLSDHSDCALHFGKNLQENHNCEVTLLHIADISGIWDWPAVINHFQTELKIGIDKRLNDQMQRCGANFKTRVIFGDRYYNLKEFLQVDNFDLLIMGHRAERPLFSGSLAKKIISSTNIPVFIVTNNNPIHKIGCLLDLSNLTKNTAEEAKLAAQLFDAEVHYFTVIPDIATKVMMTMPFALGNYSYSDEERAAIKAQAKNEIKAKVGAIDDEFIHVSISQFDTGLALSKELEKESIDLGIMAKHNRGPVEKLYIGSVSKGIIDEFKGNMLVLNSK